MTLDAASIYGPTRSRFVVTVEVETDAATPEEASGLAVELLVLGSDSLGDDRPQTAKVIDVEPADRRRVQGPTTQLTKD